MESQNEKDYTEIDLVEVFYVIRDNLRNIFVVTLCCMLLAGAYLMLKPVPAPSQDSAVPKEEEWIDHYRSKATLRLRIITNIPNFNLAQKLTTYAALTTSDAIRKPVYEALGIEEPVGSAGGSAVKDAEMMNFVFDAEDPETAQKGNELLLQRFMDYIVHNEQIETKYAVESLPGGDKVEGEKVFFQRVTCEIVTPPTLPEELEEKPKPKEDPKKPKPTPPGSNRKRTLVISALLGVLLGSGYAVMHYLMNRKITTRQDVEDYLGLPVLAVVPEEKSLTEAMSRKNDKSVLQKIGGLLWKEQN